MMNIARQEAPVRPGSLERLRDEVIDPGWCVACGACVGICPYLIFYDGMVAVPDRCTLDTGRCYDLCPQGIEKGPVENRREWLKARGRDTSSRSAHFRGYGGRGPPPRGSKAGYSMAGW